MIKTAQKFKEDADQLLIQAKYFSRHPFQRQITEEEYENHDCKGGVESGCKTCTKWVEQCEEYANIRKEINSDAINALKVQFPYADHMQQLRIMDDIRELGDDETADELEEDLCCEFCNGDGREDYNVSMSPGVNAPVGEKVCGACGGSGLNRHNVVS